MTNPRNNGVITPERNMLDPQVYRKDFPVLNREVHGKPLVYLDNAASSQMAQPVIDSYVDYHSNYHSNVHRGVHALSQEATDAFDGTREFIRNYINAESTEEIIFTSGTTDGINLISQTFGVSNIQKGDEVLISGMEHHSNIVPWKMLCDKIGAHLKVIPITDSGEIDQNVFEELLTEKTALLGIMQVSNALGTINPVKEMVAKAHEKGAVVLVDGAQAIPHMKVDVQDIDCDFFAFSGHKMFGPTGCGVLYGKKKLLEAMPPWKGGGDMILSVSFDEILYNRLPYKFEAGTPGIAQVIGLGKAFEYIESIGIENIAAWENELLVYATEQIKQFDQIRIIGEAENKASVLSFVINGIHPHDIGTVLDQEGIAIRTGHHCAQPIMERFQIPATSRASFAFYNTKEEIDALMKGLHKVIDIFS